ncbi:hypothetical protein SAMN04489726_1051 [Allokutzneria albata]|uniref:Uncharacterized protein n=1 Tax=Allokutzneria albata TaxID=211114 RepID=A0A1G9SC75_ALLAB|nr:hypothetical protein SAMN04489726_1051 [Allokutzneria albata]
MKNDRTWGSRYLRSSFEYGHESSVLVCDKEPDDSYVRGYFTMFDGQTITLRNDFSSKCASRHMQAPESRFVVSPCARTATDAP